jgi:hypothetical protein
MSSLPFLAVLFADRDDPLSRPEIVWGTLGITAVLLLGAAVIYATDKWRKRAADGARDATEALTSYRAMYEAGEITEAEYAELKRRMAEKVKKMPIPGAATAPGMPFPSLQPGERPTMNPPTPPTAPTQSPPPPSTA